MDAGSATIFPSNMAIGATGRENDAYQVALAIGEEARAVGIQIDFAPVVDVNNNPNNPVINTRSFGEDPARVARLSSLFVRGLEESGAVATAKHFPGHGDTDVDSHVGLPIVTATLPRLDSVELVPFKAAIRAGAGLVMPAHLALPAVAGDSTTPATPSPPMLLSAPSLCSATGMRSCRCARAVRSSFSMHPRLSSRRDGSSDRHWRRPFRNRASSRSHQRLCDHSSTRLRRWGRGWIAS